MDTDPDNDAARLRFYERLADSELFVMLETEAVGDKISPHILVIEDQRYVLVFDRIERLAEFADAQTPYAALPGRGLVGMIKGQGLGLGVNLGVASSSILVPATGVDWLTEALANESREVQAQVVRLTAPKGLPQDFLAALDRKLAAAQGLAKAAYLAGSVFDDASQGLILGFVDAIPDAQTALRQAVTEAVSFSATEIALDVAFLTAEDPLVAHLAQQGLRYDLPVLQPVQTQGPAAPGLDPEKPPNLR